eukprot:g28567.t1
MMEYCENASKTGFPHRATGILGQKPPPKKTAMLSRELHSWTRPLAGPLEYLDAKDEEELHMGTRPLHREKTAIPGDCHTGPKPPFSSFRDPGLAADLEPHPS